MSGKCKVSSIVKCKDLSKAHKFQSFVTMQKEKRMTNVTRTVEFEKQAGDYILNKLVAIDPYCILAGGAPRDWYFGNNCSDLDFYVYTNPNISNYLCYSMLEALGFKVLSTKNGSNIPEDYRYNPYIKTVVQSEFNGIPFQVMFMLKGTFDSVIPQFALSICKAWYKDSEKGVQVTKDFETSAKHKVIYKCSELYGDSHKYIEKIKGKFPDFKYFGSKSEMVDWLL